MIDNELSPLDIKPRRNKGGILISYDLDLPWHFPVIMLTE